MNIGVLMGRLVRDPKDYNGVVKITIAVDRGTDANGNKVTDFPSVTVFGKQAANCIKYLRKGRQVTVEYSLQTGSYTDKSGKTVYTQEAVAKRVEFNDDRKEAAAQPRAQEQTQIQAPVDDYEAVDDDVPF